MQEDRKPNILGLIIVLIAVSLVAVGVFGLLSRNDRAVISVPVSTSNTASGSAATTEQPAPIAPAAAQPIETPQETVQSAVVRGGSRGKPSQPTVTSSDASSEITLPGETTPTSSPNTSGPLASVPGAAPFRVEVLSALYDVSGKPSQGCAVFDNRVPARRFTFQLAVVNDSGADLQPGEWGAAAYTGNTRVTLCFAGPGRLPQFANRTRQQVTLVAFTTPEQSVTAVSLSTLSGLSARVCFQEERVVACPVS